MAALTLGCHHPARGQAARACRTQRPGALLTTVCCCAHDNEFTTAASALLEHNHEERQRAGIQQR